MTLFQYASFVFYLPTTMNYNRRDLHIECTYIILETVISNELDINIGQRGGIQWFLSRLVSAMTLRTKF